MFGTLAASPGRIALLSSTQSFFSISSCCSFSMAKGDATRLCSSRRRLSSPTRGVRGGWECLSRWNKLMMWLHVSFRGFDAGRPLVRVQPYANSRELEGGSPPLQEFDKKSRNILPKFGILIENLPNVSCILTGDFDRFFKRSDRFLIRSFM